MSTRTAAPGAEPFIHPALLYGSEEEYLAALVPFITDGLAAAQPVAVAVPEPKLAVLREALGTDAERVKMIDMTEAGRNPGRIIVEVLRRFADAHTHRHVRIVGEPIWPGRSADEYPACVQHEALINPAFAGRDVTIVCPYDTAGLDAQALADAHATHPEMWQADRRYRSDRYDPDDVVARYNQPFGRAPDTASLTATTLADVAAFRRFAVERATPLGLAPERLADLELIVDALVTNSLMHTQGPAQLRIWADHDHLVCEVRDTGQLTDPLAGRRPPVPAQRSGRGLVLVHGLADLLRLHTTPEGTTIRALLRHTRA